MKAKFVILVLAVALLSFASSSFAKEAKNIENIFEECGIGGALFPTWPIGASVSNVTWDLGTTAATSGLTTPDSCAGGKAKVASYIYKSYDSLEQDLAAGEGKYLDALAILTEKNLHEKGEFLSELREKFLEVVENENYSSMTRVEKASVVFEIVENLG